MSLTRAEVINIFIDQKNGVPVMLLKNVENEDTLPILIAPLEANLIAIELEGKKPLRPLTHDLLVNILDELSYNVSSIEVYDLKNNIYYAKINLSSIDNEIAIDSRPSDAIALALRTNSPIYVERKLFALYMGFEKAVEEADEEALKDMLNNIDLDDVGGKIM